MNLKSIPKEKYDEIKNYRRNSIGKADPNGSAYSACGIAGTIAVTVVVNKIGGSMRNKPSGGGGGDGGGGGNFSDDLMNKIIPTLPNQDKCNDR